MENTDYKLRQPAAKKVLFPIQNSKFITYLNEKITPLMRVQILIA